MVTCWGKNGTRTRVIENILKPDGNRVSAQVDYEYDDLYRLVHEHRIAYNGGDPGVAYEYNFAYDDAGNRTSWQTVGGSTISYAYDAANKMTSPGTFTYDDKGNTLTHVVGGVTTAYTWDYLNRMTQWQKTGETTQAYVYNGDGVRVRITPSGGTATNFLLDGAEVAEDVTGSGVTSYIAPGVVSKIDGTTRTVYHVDLLGSTRAMSDSNQAVTEAGVYDAFGNLTQGYPGSSTFCFGFAGQYRYYADATGLDYLKARYYDATVGRFISRDPIGYAGGLNLYEYAYGNPVMGVDPSGEIAPVVVGCIWLAYKTATTGWAIGNGLLALYYLKLCNDCLDRAEQYTSNAKQQMKCDEYLEWLKAAKPGFECTELCSQAGKRGAQAFIGLIFRLLPYLKYNPGAFKL